MTDKQRDTECVFEHLNRQLGLIHEVYSVGHRLPLHGELIAVSDLYITLEKRDGRIVTLLKSEIRSITPTFNQPPRPKDGGA